MRWLAILLLVANVAFFTWRFNAALQARLESAAPVAPLPADAPGLKLLSELPQLPALRSAEPEAPEGPPAKPAAAPVAEVPAPEAQAQASASDDSSGAAAEATSPDTAPQTAIPSDESALPAELVEPGQATPETTLPAPEVASAPGASTNAPQEVSTTEISGNGKPSAVCVNVGPFPRPEALVQLKRWLLRHATSVHVETRTVRKRQLFWLYLEANSDTAARRKLAELEQKGIRDYLLIQRGGLKNAISLGLFSSQDSVNKRLAEMNRKGYKPVVVPRFETTDLYWLRARLATGSEDPGAIPKDLYEGAAAATIECSEIAASEPRT